MRLEMGPRLVFLTILLRIGNPYLRVDYCWSQAYNGREKSSPGKLEEQAFLRLRHKMQWQIYGIIIIFALFVLALIFNPTLSCFGKKLKSPLYPLLRRKKRNLKTDDYGFSLGGRGAKKETKEKIRELGIKDYGLSRIGKAQHSPREKKRNLKTDDYGFSLGGDAKQESEEEKE
jgi:hypothetical protein